MMHKVTNNLVCISNDCLIPITRSLRNGYYNQLDNKIASFKFSFNQVMELNPLYIVNSPIFDQFCTRLDNYHNYTCAYNHIDFYTAHTNRPVRIKL